MTPTRSRSFRRALVESLHTALTLSWASRFAVAIRARSVESLATTELGAHHKPR